MEHVSDLVAKFQRLAEEAQKNPLPAVKSVGSTDQKIYECELCKDVGYVFVNEEGILITEHPYAGHEFAKECECEKRRRVQRMFKSSFITEEFQKLGFQNFVIENRPHSVIQAKESALVYLKTFEQIRQERQNSIAFLGEPGCGKTHLLMAVCNNLMRKGISVLYFPYVEGFNDIKDDLDQLEKKIGAMKKIDVLYIDDLYKGRKAPTDFMLEQLFAVINYRYLNHLPILLSSERDIDAICAVDMGIGSRIYEMCKDYTVLIGITEREQQQGIKLNFRLAD